ncbi:bifunctional alpha,alpha-trehalose-phosphate synthase (UDP-forming)/trehalose-phosphatase [Leucobacter aridicollis]|uniref:bifunctional alpha,alpha-trehalose-phosphate synthase (UDP-forming)/trehalose-phosphatase n=1 Tax=Leucobacter aridicollis TaxID=283878 RepID=UPI00216780D4|nr:bifunctional alpha,alpha-trehalose-phosphate synthase (UDP-forming)/trehalose-phosphatase [Leucobacter aridicollis]MCS3428854.1 trehalose 6-phosphate synthase/phosphatase [Leucobacter aridicollis]
MRDVTGGRELVMVSNRLPVDCVEAADGTKTWRTSPGGLVTAVEPIVEQLGCVWVGWEGSASTGGEPFEVASMRLIPVELSAREVDLYYEGFSNATLWPLYHDVIAPPEYHRDWWDSYVTVNERFAAQVAEVAATGAIVWVHDYQLQLVPAMLRKLRPDLTIAFFLHIPFPPRGLFAQLPWRREIIEGLLGADVLGFQRAADAETFRLTAEALTGCPVLGNHIALPARDSSPARAVLAQEFPISIDAEAFARTASEPEMQRRAREIRAELGNPAVVMLGVDRLDYTKGILHRFKAFSELLTDDELDPTDTVLVQVASPSRERVGAYMQLRNEVETAVGRINGEHGSVAHTPLVYLHQSFDREEMAALYLAADVLLVTPLRDGMNLVAKEYVACRTTDDGVLVLSEFAGAAEELGEATLVNPHDIEGLKSAIVRATTMPIAEQHRRMRAMRATVSSNDVSNWARSYLGAVSGAADAREAGRPAPTAAATIGEAYIPRKLEERLRRLAAAPQLIVATDFDGTLAPLVARPADARALPRAIRSLDILRDAAGVQVALLTGRSLEALHATGLDSAGWMVSGSHGLELNETAQQLIGESAPQKFMTPEQQELLESFTRRVWRVFKGEPGVRLEYKPFGIAVHTREVPDNAHAEELLAAARELGSRAGLIPLRGKQVCEFSVLSSDKGVTLRRIMERFPDAATVFLGDDVTDETAFAVLRQGDLGIKVGDGATRARERVGTPESAAAVLALLAELRTGVVVGSA